MELIHSKDIYYVLRDILKIIDPKIMNHGARTSYILYKMLEITGKYEKYEEAEFAMLATFHDIGAYKTDKGNDMLTYETKDVMPHSVYGYLAMLYLSPFKDRAKVILYHHTDYDKVPNSGYEYLEIIHFLNVAEKMDIYSNVLGEKFDYKMFEKQAGIKYSPRALSTLYKANEKFHIFEKLSTGEYIPELAELYENLIFTNEEKTNFVNGLIYSIGFRSEYTVLDTVTCAHICQQIGMCMQLRDFELEKLFVAAVLHDAGMVVVPTELIESPERLDAEQTKLVQSHISAVEEVLRGRLSDDVLEIILAHHEKSDGSGYPRHLRELQMNKLQKILQVADVVTSLYIERSYRPAKSKEEIISILNSEALRGRLNRDIVEIFVDNYDKIIDGVLYKSKDMLDMYKKLHENYESTCNNNFEQN